MTGGRWLRNKPELVHELRGVCDDLPLVFWFRGWRGRAVAQGFDGLKNNRAVDAGVLCVRVEAGMSVSLQSHQSGDGEETLGQGAWHYCRERMRSPLSSKQ